MIKRYFIVLGLSALLISCSTTKSIHKKEVPAGAETAVVIPAKKAEMSEDEIHSWPHADIYTDSVPGMSLEQAYAFLEGKKGTTVIVGIIDSGIDIEHEDLKDVIWVNEDEVPGNGKDDDKNGYVDDVYGWNFLGGEGTATPEQMEVTRIYKKLHAKYEGKTEADIAPEDMKEFAYYQKVKKDFDRRISEAREYLQQYQQTKVYLKDVDAETREKLGKEVYTVEDLMTLEEEDRNPYLIRVLGSGMTVEELMSYFEEGEDMYKTQINSAYNPDFDGRTATGDDAYDITDIPYGNAAVIGSVEDESHGTHVAGIALASRNNGKGIDGVAQNVKLMAVRTVPDGDEYDKDVALAIRYAVDNGAKVINMSFGKYYSPNAEWVYEAIKYAASKDVLLVHAAGNDGKDIDKSDNFPTDAPNKVDEITDNVITVGAITRHYDEFLIAPFSNYGKKNVDIFAPGLEIYSTVPQNSYKQLQGTSMAAPEVTGVAALIRSYYPQLSASQVKHILMNSGTKSDLEVILPGSDDTMVQFSELSVSGRILNAHQALKMADAMVNGK